MQLITTDTQLIEKISKIKQNEKFIAIDTEFVREKTFFPNLGIVQIGCSDDDFIIDALSPELNILLLDELLQDENIIKVFHACQQDMEIIWNYFGRLPKNIFDTQVGAKFLGFGEAVSYSRLVEFYCEKNLDKSARFTDWMKRPLDESQMSYALDDVIYLKQIYTKMCEVLRERKRYNWVIEETAKLLEPNLYQTNPDDAWKKLKLKNTNGKYINVVKELAKWRENRAKTVNRPRMWIMKDDAIQELAHIRPKTPDDLKNLRFFKFDERVSEQILEVIKNAVLLKEYPETEKNTSVSEYMMPIITLLKILLRNQSIENNIAPSVIADVDDLKTISIGEFDTSKAMSGWRYEVFGSLAKKLVEGKVALSAKGKTVLIIDLENHIN